MDAMDIALVVVIVGCGLAGAWWGALRMATGLAAALAAVLAGRFAGPVAADMLLAGRGADHGARVAVILGVGLLAALLVFLAGRGLRKGIEVLHLSWLDRLGGLAVGAAGAALALAGGLALAAAGGHPATTPWARQLATFGQAALAVQSLSNRSTSPSTTPPIPTSKGQHPN
jgi:uncharacterized membrane protein required for colicin V production